MGQRKSSRYAHEGGAGRQSRDEMSLRRTAMDTHTTSICFRVSLRIVHIRSSDPPAAEGGAFDKPVDAVTEGKNTDQIQGQTTRRHHGGRASRQA
jgi:hypothetical protein